MRVGGAALPGCWRAFARRDSQRSFVGTDLRIRLCARSPETFSVADENEAREIVNADPNIRAKVNVAELYAWDPLFTPGPRTVTAGKSFFAILYARASASGPAVETENRTRARHIEYWKAKHLAGLLVMAGAFKHAAGEAAIIAVDNPEMAERFVRGDPAVIDKLLEAELHARPAGGRLPK